MLDLLLHAPRGPFYSPKAARSRWSSIWKAILAFCQVAHRTVWCTTGHEQSCLVPDLLPFLVKTTISPSVPLVHRTLSNAHRTVRCDQVTVGLATCRPLIALPTVGCGRRWLTEQSGAHQTVWWILAAASSANSREQRVCCWTSLCTRHCRVHRRLVQFLARLSQPSPIHFSFSW